MSGDILQTPEMAVTDSIIKVPVLQSGFHFIGGGEAYCMGRSKCRAILLCAIELTKTRAIFVFPGMLLGHTSIARSLLRHELCHMYVQSINI